MDGKHHDPETPAHPESGRRHFRDLFYSQFGSPVPGRLFVVQQPTAFLGGDVKDEPSSRFQNPGK